MPSRRPSANYQMTIDDFDLGVEQIPGVLPVEDSAAEQFRAQRYRELLAVTSTEIACIPDQKIHLFPVGNERRCLCQDSNKKEPQ